MKKSEYALISRLALEKGIRFAYREKGADKDSGWRFFHSPEDYASCDSLKRIKKNNLVAFSPEVKEILSAGRGCVYKAFPNGWRKISRDNSLSALPPKNT